MVHFAEINQAPPPYSMLQYIGRVATPKLVPRNCLRYLQTTLIMEGGGLASEFMWGIVGVHGEKKSMETGILFKKMDIALVKLEILGNSSNFYPKDVC